VKLGKYIQLLLPEYETVIIPGFGAFVSTYKPAEIDKDSGEIKPPSKAVTFNQKIRNNDGLLVATIAEKEGISHFEALQKIEKEREDMLYRLDKGEKIVLEKIGELQYDEQHNIQFNPIEGENFLLDAFGLEAASPTKEIVEKNPPSEGVKEPEPVAEENEDRKKSRGWLWFLLILLPLIFVGIIMIRKDYEENGADKGVDETLEITYDSSNEPASEAVPDSVQSDTTSVAGVADSAIIAQPDSSVYIADDSTQLVAEELTDSAKFVEPDPSKFYLVAGSFKEKENADKFYADLKSEGFHPFHLGKQGNFYIVGLGEYESERQAFRAQDDFLETHPGSGVWIYQAE
jgi:nucleoid DNA-binding protein